MADTRKYRAGGGDSCAIVGCANNRKKLFRWRHEVCDKHSILHDDCPCLLPFTLHRLPADDSQRLRWVKAINRKDLPKRVFVCSCHFEDGLPTQKNPIPSIAMGVYFIYFCSQLKSHDVLLTHTGSVSLST